MHNQKTQTQFKNAKKSKGTVLVTGCSSGIGQALALELSENGYLVYAGIRKRRAELTWPENDNLRPIRLDICSDAEIQTALKKIHRDGAKVDILINNAGFGIFGAAEEMPPKLLREQMETNFFATVRLTQHVLPAMRQRRRGLVVNISSILGRVALPACSAYCASKWALEAYSEALYYELAPLGVNVVIIEPGLVGTRFKQNTRFEHALEASDFYFLNRYFQREYGRRPTSARQVAKDIARIIRKKKPSLRYRLGTDAKAANLMRALLPGNMSARIIETFVKNVYKAQ